MYLYNTYFYIILLYQIFHIAPCVLYFLILESLNDFIFPVLYWITFKPLCIHLHIPTTYSLFWCILTVYHPCEILFFSFMLWIVILMDKCWYLQLAPQIFYQNFHWLKVCTQKYVFIHLHYNIIDTIMMLIIYIWLISDSQFSYKNDYI